MLSWIRSLVVAACAMLCALGMASAAYAQEVVEYYGTDNLGSIRVVFNATGTIVSRADYLPFGEELSASGPMPAERFTGQARDGEAGMDYVHARQFQPRTGRFNAVDPVYAGLFDPQQWNRYVYARGNPFSYADPTGTTNVCVGAYYCPASVVGPPGGLPNSSWVEARFDGNRAGYQGGELAAAEQRYATAVATQFFSASDWGKGVLGGGQLSNNSGRSVRSKDESGEGARTVKPGERNVPSDGFYDADRAGVLFPISDGILATFQGDGTVSLGLTPRAELFAALPGGRDSVPGALFAYGAYKDKNQWVDHATFVGSLKLEDKSWDNFLGGSWSPR